MNFGLLRVHQLEFDCIPCKLAFPQCGSRCFHAWWKSKPRHKHQVEKVGQLWPRCTKVYIVKSSTWELTGDVPRWKRGVSGNYIFVEWFRLQVRERSRFSLQGCKSSENFRKKTAQIATKSASKIERLLRSKYCLNSSQRTSNNEVIKISAR